MIDLAVVLFWLCVLGVLVAAVGWVLVSATERRHEQIRQEVRAALADAFFTPAVEVVVCERHLTVSMDACHMCVAEEVAALARPGFVPIDVEPHVSGREDDER